MKKAIRQNYVRIIGGMTLTAFLFTSAPVPLTHAEAPTIIPSQLFPQNSADIKIPQEFGSIQESFTGDKGETVVLIQDAHAIPDAQRSIQDILDHLQKKYGLRLVGTEAAAGQLDPELFRSFPDMKVLEKVFEKYHESGELTGVAAAAIFNQMPSVYEGVEDWHLYEEGLGFYQEAMAKENAIRKELEVRRLKLEKEKQKFYSKELLEVDQAMEKFQTNARDFIETLKVLAKHIKPEKGSELELLAAEAENPEVSTEVEIEIKNLAIQIRKNLKASVLTEFNKKFQEFQTSHLSPAEFAAYLIKADSSASGFIMTEELRGLIRNHKRMRDIEGTRLFEDFEAYSDSVKARLITKEEEKRLNSESHQLHLLEKLSRLELSRKDWKEIQPPLAPKMTANIQFYENAEKREEAFLRHLTKLMKKHAAKSSALVAGGFHKDGLVQKLKQENISYVVIMPQITALPEHSNYQKLMKGQTSWKDYFEVKNGKVDLYQAFARGVRDKLLAYSVQGAADKETGKDFLNAGLLKLWRDQIIRNLAQKEKISTVSRHLSLIDEAVKGDENKPQWQIKMEEFLNKLNQLDAVNQATEQNIVKLFNPATMGLTHGLSRNTIPEWAVRSSSPDQKATGISKKTRPDVGSAHLVQSLTFRRSEARTKKKVATVTMEEARNSIVAKLEKGYAGLAEKKPEGKRAAGTWIKGMEQWQRAIKLLSGLAPQDVSVLELINVLSALTQAAEFFTTSQDIAQQIAQIQSYIRSLSISDKQVEYDKLEPKVPFAEVLRAMAKGLETYQEALANKKGRTAQSLVAALERLKASIQQLSALAKQKSVSFADMEGIISSLVGTAELLTSQDEDVQGAHSLISTHLLFYLRQFQMAAEKQPASRSEVRSFDAMRGKDPQQAEIRRLGLLFSAAGAALRERAKKETKTQNETPAFNIVGSFFDFLRYWISEDEEYNTTLRLLIERYGGENSKSLIYQDRPIYLLLILAAKKAMENQQKERRPQDLDRRTFLRVTSGVLNLFSLGGSGVLPMAGEIFVPSAEYKQPDDWSIIIEERWNDMMAPLVRDQINALRLKIAIFRGQQWAPPQHDLFLRLEREILPRLDEAAREWARREAELIGSSVLAAYHYPEMHSTNLTDPEMHSTNLTGLAGRVSFFSNDPRVRALFEHLDGLKLIDDLQNSLRPFLLRLTGFISTLGPEIAEELVSAGDVPAGAAPMDFSARIEKKLRDGLETAQNESQALREKQTEYRKTLAKGFTPTADLEEKYSVASQRIIELEKKIEDLRKLLTEFSFFTSRSELRSLGDDEGGEIEKTQKRHGWLRSAARETLQLKAGNDGFFKILRSIIALAVRLNQIESEYQATLTVLKGYAGEDPQNPLYNNSPIYPVLIRAARSLQASQAPSFFNLPFDRRSFLHTAASVAGHLLGGGLPAAVSNIVTASTVIQASNLDLIEQNWEKIIKPAVEAEVDKRFLEEGWGEAQAALAHKFRQSVLTQAEQNAHDWAKKNAGNLGSVISSTLELTASGQQPEPQIDFNNIAGSLFDMLLAKAAPILGQSAKVASSFLSQLSLSNLRGTFERSVIEPAFAPLVQFIAKLGPDMAEQIMQTEGAAGADSENFSQNVQKYLREKLESEKLKLAGFFQKIALGFVPSAEFNRSMKQAQEEIQKLTGLISDLSLLNGDLLRSELRSNQGLVQTMKYADSVDLELLQLRVTVLSRIQGENKKPSSRPLLEIIAEEIRSWKKRVYLDAFGIDERTLAKSRVVSLSDDGGLLALGAEASSAVAAAFEGIPNQDEDLRAQLREISGQPVSYAALNSLENGSTNLMVIMGYLQLDMIKLKDVFAEISRVMAWKKSGEDFVSGPIHFKPKNFANDRESWLRFLTQIAKELNLEIEILNRETSVKGIVFRFVKKSTTSSPSQLKLKIGAGLERSGKGERAFTKHSESREVRAQAPARAKLREMAKQVVDHFEFPTREFDPDQAARVIAPDVKAFDRVTREEITKRRTEQAVQSGLEVRRFFAALSPDNAALKDGVVLDYYLTQAEIQQGQYEELVMAARNLNFQTGGRVMVRIHLPSKFWIKPPKDTRSGDSARVLIEPQSGKNQVWVYSPAFSPSKPLLAARDSSALKITPDSSTIGRLFLTNQLVSDEAWPTARDTAARVLAAGALALALKPLESERIFKTREVNGFVHHSFLNSGALTQMQAVIEDLQIRFRSEARIAQAA